MQLNEALILYIQNLDNERLEILLRCVEAEVNDRKQKEAKQNNNLKPQKINNQRYYKEADTKKTGKTNVISKATENPLESIFRTMTLTLKDWGADGRSAWIYGIVCGWSEEDLKNLALSHNWNKNAVERLKRLNAEFKKLLNIQNQKQEI